MKKPSKATREYLRALGRRVARARLVKLTAAQRSEVARKAARARWAKRRSP